jgi:hypothetical protein
MLTALLVLESKTDAYGIQGTVTLQRSFSHTASLYTLASRSG